MRLPFSRPLGGIILASLVGGLETTRAQVVLDGKFGTSGALAGPNYAVAAEVGAIRGNNLFHSFSQFNLVSGDVAAFSGPANIQNILARVTGGTPSSIDGTIRSEIAGASFFLMNPKGIIFGPNAAIDVTGSFAATTADYLKLADGARFVAALNADDSTLTTAPVAAFGFLGSQPGSLSVEQSTLGVMDGKTVSLVGGDISLNAGSLRAPGGQINAVSVQGPGEVPLDPQTIASATFASTFPQQGAIDLQNGAHIEGSGEGGGRVVIRGGRLTVDNSKIEANTAGAGNGQGIDIAVTGDLNLSNGGQINSLSPGGLGASGNIQVTAQSVHMDGGGAVDDFFNPTTQISAATGDPFSGGGPAKGGDVLIRAGRLEMVNSAQISSASFGAGNAGRIEIDASSILLDAQLVTPTQITANTQQIEGGGKAGDIVIRTGSFDLLNGATILAASFGSGSAGLVDISAQTFNIVTGGIITAGTFGSGEGGSVQVAAERLHIDGGGQIAGIQAITTSSDSPAPGGNIEIKTDSLELLNSGSIFTTSYGLGRSGNIQITAQSVRMDGGGVTDESFNPTTKISAATGDPALGGGSANGGNVLIRVGQLEMVNSAEISSATFGSGNAGRIEIEASSLLMDAQLITPTQITANTYQTEGGGKAGDIVIRADNLKLLNGATVLAASFGTGEAGIIDISAKTADLFNGGTISAGTFDAGRGGNVQVAAGTLRIDGGFLQAVTTSDASPAPGGNVEIKSDSLELLNSGSIFTTSYGLGQGGNIGVSTRALTMDTGSSIRAAGELTGPAGNISVGASGPVLLENRSSVSTSAPGSSGGNISVRAGSDMQLFSSEITAQAGLNGGNISLASPTLIYLLESTVTAQADATGTGFGNGGNLTLESPGVVMNRSSLISKSSFGNGGNISILSDYFFPSDSIIDASAPFGLPGTVQVTAPQVDLSGALVLLPGNLLDASTLLRPDCGVRLGGNISSFIMMGRGGLPIAPWGFAPSPAPGENNDHK